MGLLGLFSAVSMATGWRLGPVKLSKASESRSGGGDAGTEGQLQRLARISSFLLLPSLVVPLLFSHHLKYLPVLDALQVPKFVFPFQTGTALVQHAVQTLRGPSLRNQSKLRGRVESLLRNSKTCFHTRSNSDGHINSHLHFRAFSKLPSSRTDLL